ncbi:MAG: hypothetical protein IVW53_14830 [Chloroflexi bacterium]|nr:hypothetical protein [Chloroflexota bacterium]MBF6606841.1 hypothetical protein [Chloroflexota bacterium]
MDLRGLAQAFDGFLAAAEGTGPAARPSDEWTPQMVVAHIIANNRLIAAHLAEALSGREPAYDNRPAVRLSYLEAIVQAAGDWVCLVDEARRSAVEVMQLAGLVDDATAVRRFPTRVEDGNRVRIDEPVSIAHLLDAQAEVHLPSHAGQLRVVRTGTMSRAVA